MRSCCVYPRHSTRETERDKCREQDISIMTVSFLSDLWHVRDHIHGKVFRNTDSHLWLLIALPSIIFSGVSQSSMILKGDIHRHRYKAKVLVLFYNILSVIYSVLTCNAQHYETTLRSIIKESHYMINRWIFVLTTGPHFFMLHNNNTMSDHYSDTANFSTSHTSPCLRYFFLCGSQGRSCRMLYRKRICRISVSNKHF